MTTRTLSILSTFLVIAYFFITIKRNRDSKLWVIISYLLISFFTDITFIEFHYSKNNEFYVYSFFTIIEFTSLSLFFYFILSSTLFKKILIVIFPLFYILAFLYIILYNPSKYSFDSLTAPIEAIILIVYSILFFFEQLSNPAITFIYESKNFWIVAGIIIYLSSSLFLFVTAAYLTENEMDHLWFITHVANIIKNVLFAIAFKMHPNERLKGNLPVK